MLQNLARTAKGEVSDVNFNHGLTMIENTLATACEKKIMIFHRIIFVCFGFLFLRSYFVCFCFFLHFLPILLCSFSFYAFFDFGLMALSTVGYMFSPTVHDFTTRSLNSSCF